MTARLRRLWLRIHRWLALSVGWILAAVALMGALLVVANPLDQRLHPALFRARAAAAAPAVTLEAVRARLLAEFGKGATLTFLPPRTPGATLAVRVRAGWNGTVYIDPAGGAEQGRRGETEGLRNLVFTLHSSLGLQDTGKAVLAAIALAYLVLLLTGLVLWWPRRWPPALRIELRKGLVRGLFDVHRTGGAVLGLFIAVSVASGAYMAFKPLGDVVNTLTDARPLKAPKLPKLARTAHVPAPPLDALVAAARARFPGAPVSFVLVPAEPDRPLRVRLILPDDPHPNGLTMVWLDPRTGAVLAARRWNELDPGARAVAVLYPLHTGELGGVALEAFVALNGLALGTLGISGIWLWYRRRRRAAAAAPAASAT